MDFLLKSGVRPTPQPLGGSILGYQNGEIRRCKRINWPPLKHQPENLKLDRLTSVNKSLKKRHSELSKYLNNIRKRWSARRYNYSAHGYFE